MKLYISGAIAADPDFKEKFKTWWHHLDGAGFEAVNPVEVNACLDQNCGGSFLDTDTETESTSEFIHSWQCYMRYDLVEMLQCDGVAALDDAMESPGARAEMYVAGLVGIPVKPIRKWIVEAVIEALATQSAKPIQTEEEFLASMDKAVMEHLDLTNEAAVGHCFGADDPKCSTFPAHKHRPYSFGQDPLDEIAGF
jgi:hypothetical protein